MSDNDQQDGLRSRRQRAGGMAGGVFIAGGTLGGALLGMSFGQPSLGLVLGLGSGIAAAILFSLGLRRRS